MKLTVPELKINDGEGFSTEKDLFIRKPFGDRLYNLIMNSDDNLVLALDAQWGEGKSTRINISKSLLLKQYISMHLKMITKKNHS